MYSIMIIDDSHFGFNYTVIDNFNKEIIRAGVNYDCMDIIDLLDHIKVIIKEYEKR